MWITPADLALFATIDAQKAQAMIDDVESLARLAAPCLTTTELSDDQEAAVRAILRGAILRWHDTGSGALTQETVGPFSATYDNRQRRYAGLTDTESAKLREVCATGGSRKVFTVSTRPAHSPHVPWCNVNLGATYCSCGADLTNYTYPLYEL